MDIHPEVVAKVVDSRVQAVELVEAGTEVLVLLEELEAGVTGNDRLVPNTALLDSVGALGAARTSSGI